jgi:hypothetical protein
MAREPSALFEVLNEAEILEKERQALELDASAQPSALCLSGGGIRSAAFCLGALQAFAAKSLLRQFHYLSTVSGGGYIGAWLTRCIAEQNTISGSPRLSNVVAVEECILARREAREAPELERLRRYTNYLAPRPGVASNDTWAGVVLWLRNTLINWAVFLPLMLAAASAAVLYSALVCASATGPAAAWAGGAGVIALLGLGRSVHRTCLDLPSHKHPDSTPPGQAGGLGVGEKQVLKQIVLPAMAWVFLVPWSLAPLLAMAPPSGPSRTAFWLPAGLGGQWSWWLAVLPACSWVVCIGAYLLAWHWVLRSYKGAMDLEQRRTHSRAFLVNLPGWVFSTGVSSLMLAVGIWLASGGSALWLGICGPVWVMTAELLRSAAYVAVRRDGVRMELDREWLARLNGNKLRLVLAFGAASTATLYLPTLILDRPNDVWAAIMALAGFLAGPAAAMMGKSVKVPFLPTPDKVASSRVRIDWIIGAAIIVFIAALFMLLGRLATLIACALTRNIASGTSEPFLVLAGFSLGVMLAGAAIAGSLDWAVNLNRFSMHAVYRNRLVRAFLGTAREPRQRHPDRYTSFDPEDNIRVADSFTNRELKALFPVINVALNRTSGKDTAHAERKAEPFTITPLHCGSASLDREQTGIPRGAYIPTEFFAGADRETGPGDKEKGITLGTAITLSGAAVSPNMGYHSSALAAFVMTLFNLRLGAWLPNPGWKSADGHLRIDKNTAEHSGPIHAIPTMLAELAGQSDDRNKYVYLSDGGHFDNLGLYEMLRRRCGLIVVVDAGRDPDYSYFDLGHALQRARIDMGVQVQFVQPVKVGDQNLSPHGAYAKVTYPRNGAVAEQRGDLLYLKPWLSPDTPIELAAFKAVKASFPHETTADQFFTESDFESYRRLGEYLTDAVLKRACLGERPTLQALFEALCSSVQRCATGGQLPPVAPA